MALGDSVIVLIDIGAGKVREEIVKAGSAGGNVKVKPDASGAIVSELTRNGRELRQVRVPLSRLVAIIEQPKGR